jgi:hypothetical protein
MHCVFCVNFCRLQASNTSKQPESKEDQLHSNGITEASNGGLTLGELLHVSGAQQLMQTAALDNASLKKHSAQCLQATAMFLACKVMSLFATLCLQEHGSEEHPGHDLHHAAVTQALEGSFVEAGVLEQ